MLPEGNTALALLIGNANSEYHGGGDPAKHAVGTTGNVARNVAANTPSRYCEGADLSRGLQPARCSVGNAGATDQNCDRKGAHWTEAAPVLKRAATTGRKPVPHGNQSRDREGAI